MAFADYDAYLDALKANIAGEWQMSTATNVSVTRFGNYSRDFLIVPTTPTTSVALDKTDARAINTDVSNAGTGRLSILGARLTPSGIGGIAIMLADILNINGGLDGTITTAQTTNLPTAALTRYTTGEGVHAALVIHLAVGTTATTATVSYTNQSNVSGRTSTAVVFGGSGFRETGSLIRIPLQGADTGIRSVESVTIAATTGTIGNFGVLLYKPLAFLFANDAESANVIDCVSSGRMVGQMSEVLDDACLSVFGVAPSGGTQSVQGLVFLGEA
jgi:hypothetical protein